MDTGAAHALLEGMAITKGIGKMKQAGARPLVVAVALLGVLVAGGPAFAAEPLTLEETVMLAVERSLDLGATACRPAMGAAQARALRTFFDPTMRVKAYNGMTPVPAGITPGLLQSREYTMTVGVSQKTSTGITWSLEYSPVQQSGSLMLGGSTGQSLVLQNNARASVVVPLMRDAGSVNLAAVRRADVQRHLETLGLNTRTLDVVANAERAWWALIMGHRIVERRREALAQARDFLETVRQRVESGALASYQVFEAEHSVTVQTMFVTQAQRELEAARDRLALLLQVPSSEVAIPRLPAASAEQPPTPTIDELVKEAVEQRPEVGQARAAVKVAELEGQVARNGSRPRLDLTAELFTDTRTPGSTGYRAGVDFTLPLGTTGARADDERARLEVLHARLQLEAARQAVEQDVRRAVREMEAAADRASSARRAFAASRELLEAEKLRFDTGLVAAAPVLLAAQKMNDASDQEALAELEMRVAQVDLMRARGAALLARGIDVGRLIQRAVEEARRQPRAGRP